MLIPKSLQQELLGKTTWNDALSLILSANTGIDNWTLKAHILDMRSTFWRFLLPKPAQGNILHIGSADWGKNALALGKSVSKITYWDNQEWRLRLVEILLNESGLPNVEFINQMPQTSAGFDLMVIYNTSVIGGIIGLPKIFPLLKPGGVLYINTEDSSEKCRKLLSKTGFNDITIYSSVPHYLHFNYIIPIDEKPIFHYRLEQMTKDGLSRKLKRWAISILLRLDILKYFMTNFSIIAQK
jgi:hypothetical protein